MPTLLHLDSSPNGDSSHSRSLTKYFVDAWKKEHPTGKTVYRDVGHAPVPHVTKAWITGAYSLPISNQNEESEVREVMQLSDSLVDEFLIADRLVFGVPMHNFSVPSTFKAYVDQIVRLNRTFGQGWKGLATGKKLLVITARGGSYPPGSPSHAYDCQEPWIRTIFGFIGVTDVIFVHAEGMLGEETKREASLTSAKRQLDELIKNW